MKSISLALMLAAVMAVGIGAIATNNVLAKESSCDVSAGGKCLIIAKRGDVEIDKLTIVVSGGGGTATNLTEINNAISVLQGQVSSQDGQLNSMNTQLSDLSTKVANFSSGITSIEITPVNETGGGNTTQPVQCQPGTHEENGSCVTDNVTPPTNETNTNSTNSTG